MVDNLKTGNRELQIKLKGLNEQANLSQGELVHYWLNSRVNSFKFRSCSALDDDMHSLPKYNSII
jgi:hypothetical protein